MKKKDQQSYTYNRFKYGGPRIRLFKGIRCKNIETETVSWIKKNMMDGGVFYDIGANVGIYSIIASKLSPVDIYSFEPGAFNIPALIHNIINNNCQKSITVISNPLFCGSKFAHFNYSTTKEGKSSHVYDRTLQHRRCKKIVFSQKMLSISIDDLVQKHNCPIPNFIKLDVDGNELDILHGSQTSLNNLNLKTILVEIEGKDVKSIPNLLEGKYGFRKSIKESSNRNWIYYR